MENTPHRLDRPVPKKIYRYLDFGGAVPTLRDASLKITSPLDFNDPFEMKHTTTLVFCEEKAVARYVELQRRGGEALHTLEEYISQQRLNFFVGGTIVNDLVSAGIVASVAAVCFSEDAHLIPLWSYYTGRGQDAHKGAVIEFDTETEFFDALRGALHCVAYEPQRVRLPAYRTDVRFMYTKSTAWSHEQEVRLLVPLSMSYWSEGLRLVRFPREIVTAIYMGARLEKPNDFAAQAREWGYKHAAMFQMVEDPELFALVSNPVGGAS